MFVLSVFLEVRRSTQLSCHLQSITKCTRCLFNEIINMVLLPLNILLNKINRNIIYYFKVMDSFSNENIATSNRNVLICYFTETELGIVEVIYYRFNIMYTTRHLDFVKLHLTTRIIWALKILLYHSCLCNY